MASWKKRKNWIGSQTGGYYSLLQPFPDQFEWLLSDALSDALSSYDRIWPMIKLKSELHQFSGLFYHELEFGVIGRGH